VHPNRRVKMENKEIVCPNEACKKPITKPLSTINLQESKEPYDACPNCLTKIEKPKTQTTEPKIEAPEIKQPTEQTKQEQQENTSCKHFKGYLNKRDKTQEIPQECILCPDNIDCMLQKTN